MDNVNGAKWGRLAPFVQTVVDQGFTVERIEQRKHFKLHTREGPMFVVAGTPGCRRALANFTATVRRAAKQHGVNKLQQ